MKQVLLGLALVACSSRTQIAIDYRLVDIPVGDVTRVETLVAVDPSDGREFFADQPYRDVTQGVGYEVRDFDGSGHRKVLITHDLTLGFAFSDHWTFTLLPPSGEKAPPLILVARVDGTSDRIGGAPMVRASFGSGTHVAVPLMDLRCAGATCATGKICCRGTCADTTSDPANCGACDVACGVNADGCALGTCRCGSGSACSDGQTCCSGLGCLDITNSPFHCGACDKACNPGETCENGQCKCAGGKDCGDGGLCCPQNGCSNTGTCPCGSADCPAPEVCCDPSTSSCIDVRSAGANCGACGVSCLAPLSCQNGACTCHGQACGVGDECCSSGCASLKNDAANCGACGHACAANETCSDGMCRCGMTMCDSGQACCSGTCLDLSGDSMNCGGCGNLCNPGESCVAGMCVCPGTTPARACTSPPEGCCGSSSLDGGGCFDLTSSHDHCGGCGIACKSNEQCQGSHCVATSCDPVCTNRNGCFMGACQCNGGNSCSGPDTCCDGSGCVDTSQDPGHCGNCNTACDDTSLCCNSGCVPRNPQHCQSCNQGCATGGSTTNSAYCCAAGDNWQCVQESAQNCGGCGKQCATGQLCCGGSCKGESDFACGTACNDCNAQGLVCCNHQCCKGNCCNGTCCNGLCTLGACVL